MKIIAIFGLFLGIWVTSINITRIIAKQDISTINFLLMSIGWTIFISFMWIF